MKRFLLSLPVLAGLFGAAVNSQAATVPHATQCPQSVATFGQRCSLYVWSYTRVGLSHAIRRAELDGFIPVGFPRYCFVPEAGGMAWMIYIQ